MAKPQLLGISGSLRADACNTKLVCAAAAMYPGAELTMADIRFPLYDGDLEEAQGVPAEVTRVAEQIAAADAVLISTPEYNKGPSGVLKNALDWISRAGGAPWADKPVAVMSAAAGRAGGERAQMVLRGFLVAFRPRVLAGPEIHLADGPNQFDETGALISDRYARDVQALMEGLAREVGR